MDSPALQTVTAVKGARFAFGPFRLESPVYKAVFAAKRCCRGRTLALWYATLPDAGRKAGVIVSKRVFPRAVDRNRAKRLMREAFRLSRAHVAPEACLVMIARGGIGGRTCTDVIRDFESVCRHAGIWREVP